MGLKEMLVGRPDQLGKEAHQAPAGGRGNQLAEEEKGKSFICQSIYQ